MLLLVNENFILLSALRTFNTIIKKKKNHNKQSNSTNIEKATESQATHINFVSALEKILRVGGIPYPSPENQLLLNLPL